jgi:DNA-binding beta-propeller fold protein YncE
MLKIEIALLTLLALWPICVFAAPAMPSVTLDASMEQPAYREGQPVMLALTLHNNIAKNLFTASAFEASAFQITVTDEAGRSVPRTAVGERILTPPTAVDANMVSPFSPGQTLSYRFNLARLFDLSRAGVYTVTVSRRFIQRVQPRPAADAPPADTPVQEIVLSAGPLTVRMEEDAAAQSGPVPFVAPPSRQPFIYAAGPDTDGISHYLVGDDGSLSFSTAYSPLGSPRVAKGTDSLVTTPDGRFLYVGSAGDDNTVSQFRIGENGVLFPLSPPAVPAQKFPGLLLIDPHGRFLYSLSNWGNTLYTIGKDGRLTVTALMPSDAWAKERIHMVVPSDFGLLNSSGSILYACNGRVCGYRLAPNGSVTSLSPLGDGMTEMDDVGRVNAVALSPDDKFAYCGVSTKNGTAFFDLVVPMRVEAAGTFTPISNAAQTPPATSLPSPGFQPFLCTTLAVDPTGRFLIVVNPGYLDCYRIGPDGTLKFLNLTEQKGDLTSVFFGPVDHLIYVLNRNPAPLTAFRLDAEHGLVSSNAAMPSGIAFSTNMASAVAPTPLKWGPVSGGVSVSARLSADVLLADAPIVLTVTLKNETQHPVQLGAAGLDIAGFRLAVAGPQRQSPGVLRGAGEPLAGLVPLLAAGRDLFGNPSSSKTPMVLLPGKARQYRFVLSRLVDLTVAGYYTAQITRLLPSGAEAASPIMPFLLDGAFDGRVRDGKYQVQIL